MQKQSVFTWILMYSRSAHRLKQTKSNFPQKIKIFTKVVPCHKQLNNVISMQLLTKNMYKEMNYNKLGCSKVRYVRE